ncbi:4-amino-4-deoxy-L-arabinose transferase and related glycosyltransferase of PMT family [Synechococcus sp. A18-25c]|uniref:ArnT family glycosyltransferase n=1 Tax=Synechococcus sp. A18-25c TaxID=1866938 RepID=UPI0016464DCE|nr:glycosyltransferase family 39 protein [Synechococcus sp. A18-25c]QNJ19292.1 4-amino-4-deoxy-L-arabinose transferase and related glycosyltransferase of PMT family [Synechococcus sp. A18-25c]
MTAVSSAPIVPTPRQRRRGLLLILALGVALCCWKLGSTGLVDETPPLFAASGRAMAETGDWLTPRVNGLPRFDKPPLVYWLMGLGYALPGHQLWDPLGTWAARLPSALASVVTMLAIGDTLMRHPGSEDDHPRRTAVAAALAFGLSPLVLIWSRTAVSDALLNGTLALSLLCQWRCYVSESERRWWLAWILLATAVLTKGPVAVVLTGMTLLLFAITRRDLAGLWRRLRPLPGLLITAAISLPWYVAELLVEGQPFWDSFFGYHNLQRLTSVVNDHLQPWWFFGPVLVVASLPFTPLLLLGLGRVLTGFFGSASTARKPSHDSLIDFAGCWLLAVLLLFTAAATKLPSYWLPATPAAALIMAITARPAALQRRWALLTAWSCIAGLVLILTVGFWLSSLWIPLIQDPEMPTLPAELLASGLVLRSAVCFSVALFLGLWCLGSPVSGRLLAWQGPLVAFQLFALVPMIQLGDRVRQLPVRLVAEQVVAQRRTGEPLAMIGVLKPSLHFYTGQVVIYEGESRAALMNLADRLNHERRQGFEGRPRDAADGSPSVLVVINTGTAAKEHWQDLQPQILAREGIYELWRLDRERLEERADALQASGVVLTWRKPRPERY